MEEQLSVLPPLPSSREKWEKRGSSRQKSRNDCRKAKRNGTFNVYLAKPDKVFCAPLHLPSILSRDSCRFLGNLAIFSLPIHAAFSSPTVLRFPLPSLLIPPHPSFLFLLFSRIVDWLKIGTLNEVSKSLSARTPSDYRSDKAGFERGRTCKISKINLFGTLANYAFLDRVSRFHPFHLDRSSRSLDSSKMKSIGKELENRRRTHATRSEEEKRKRKETGANVEMDRSWNADRISGNLIDCYSTGRVMETCQVSFV